MNGVRSGHGRLDSDENAQGPEEPMPSGTLKVGVPGIWKVMRLVLTENSIKVIKFFESPLDVTPTLLIYVSVAKPPSFSKM